MSKIRYNMEGENMLEEFYQLKDETKVAFITKIASTNIPSLGITIPKIKTFVKSHDITYDTLDQIPLNQYIEQDVLYGLFLNKLAKNKDKAYYQHFLAYVKYLDNWITCDTFVSSTKFKLAEYDQLYQIISYLLKQEGIMTRCGLVLLKKYFIKEKPFDEIFKLIKTIQYGLYYVDMGCAWLLATMACFDFEYIYSHLDEIASMSFFVYKKTIQKMKESYLITPFQKDRLKKFVRIAQKDRAAAS